MLLTVCPGAPLSVNLIPHKILGLKWKKSLQKGGEVGFSPPLWEEV
jgi:hypothetical protein